MGPFDKRACPNCDGELDPEGLKDGSYWCERCGRLYRDEGDGVLIHLPPGYSQGRPSGRNCVWCEASLDGGEHYLPYENGSNSHAYIICPSCKQENIQYGFGEDD